MTFSAVGGGDITRPRRCNGYGVKIELRQRRTGADPTGLMACVQPVISGIWFPCPFASSYASTVILMLEGSTPNVLRQLGLCLRDGERTVRRRRLPSSVVSLAQQAYLTRLISIHVAIGLLARPAPDTDSMYRIQVRFTPRRATATRPAPTGWSDRQHDARRSRLG